MKKELKQEIINFIFEHENDFQLPNNTIHRFRDYIYDSKGEYLIGGCDVMDFIKQAIDLLTIN